MLDISPENLATLIPPLKVGGAPAAWWVTDAQVHLDEWDAHVAAKEEWNAAVDELVRDAGADPDGVRLYSGFGNNRLAGFLPLNGQAPATGWRVDSKSGLVVPSRRTKVDRESDSTKRFESLTVVPSPNRYVTGIGDGLFLPGMWYGVTIVRRGPVLLAFCNGDPDRVDPEDRRDFEVDDTWTRLPLSTFHLLHERDELAA